MGGSLMAPLTPSARNLVTVSTRFSAVVLGTAACVAHGGPTYRGGEPAFDRDGERVGTVEDLYLDRANGEPALALVSSGRKPGTGSEWRVVPLLGATKNGGSVTLGFPLEQIAAAPSAAGEPELTPERQQAIYAHYGVELPSAPVPREQAADAPTEQLPPDAGAPPPVVPGDAMTVSEEQLVVDKVSVPAERVRVAKHVVTEQVTVAVTVRREELRIDREPVTDPDAVELAPEAAIGDSEMEFFLLAEEPVVSTRVVPLERVRLGKDAVIEERQVTGEVHKEQIDVEREAGV